MVSTNNFTVTYPVPVVTSVSPVSLTCGVEGCAGQKVTITGTGFRGNATVPAFAATVATCGAPTGGGTQVECTLLKQLKGATYALKVSDVSYGASSTTSVPFSIYLDAAPTVESVSPSVVNCDLTSGCSGQSVTITGTGFKNDATVPAFAVGTSNCSYVNSTQMNCALTSTTKMGAYKLVVKNVLDNTTAVVSTNNFTVTYPVPSVVSVTPSALKCGDLGCAGQVITIKGRGFRNDAIVPAFPLSVATCAAPTNSGTQIVCTLLAQTKGGNYSVAVSDLTYAAKAMSAPSLVITLADPPIVSSVSPWVVNCDLTNGCSGQSVTITGTGFKTGATVPAFATGTASCAYVSATQVKCDLTNITKYGSYSLAVKNVIDNVSSVAVGPNFQVNYTLPKVTSVSPASVDCTNESGCSGKSVTITGSGFRDSATVPAFATGAATCGAPTNNGTQIVCNLTAATKAGAYKLAVSDASFGATALVSATNFTVNYPLPTVTSISPASVDCDFENGCFGKSVTITGTGFKSNSTVSAFAVGQAKCGAPTNNGTQIVCDLTYTTKAGSYKLTVSDPIYGATAVVAAANFAVNYPLPTVTSVSPVSVNCTSAAGCAGKSVTITGTGFRDDATVPAFPAGTASCGAPTAGGTQIVCSLNSLTKGGAYKLAVSDATYAAAAVVTATNFTVYYDLPTVTSVSPSTVECSSVAEGGCAGKSITINGTGFSFDATVPAFPSNAAVCGIPTDNGTKIVCALTATTRIGTYKLAVKNTATAATSLASTTNFTTVLVDIPLTVTGVTPSSLFCASDDVRQSCAGEKFVITGTGFGSSATVPVFWGPGVNSIAGCDTPTNNGTRMECTLTSAARVGTYKLRVKRNSSGTVSSTFANFRLDNNICAKNRGVLVKLSDYISTPTDFAEDVCVTSELNFSDTQNCQNSLSNLRLDPLIYIMNEHDPYFLPFDAISLRDYSANLCSNQNFIKHVQDKAGARMCMSFMPFSYESSSPFCRSDSSSEGVVNNFDCTTVSWDDCLNFESCKRAVPAFPKRCVNKSVESLCANKFGQYVGGGVDRCFVNAADYHEMCRRGDFNRGFLGVDYLNPLPDATSVGSLVPDGEGGLIDNPNSIFLDLGILSGAVQSYITSSQLPDALCMSKAHRDCKDMGGFYPTGINGGMPERFLTFEAVDRNDPLNPFRNIPDCYRSQSQFDCLAVQGGYKWDAESSRCFMDQGAYETFVCNKQNLGRGYYNGGMCWSSEDEFNCRSTPGMQWDLATQGCLAVSPETPPGGDQQNGGPESCQFGEVWSPERLRCEMFFGF